MSVVSSERTGTAGSGDDVLETRIKRSNEVGLTFEIPQTLDGGGVLSERRRDNEGDRAGVATNELAAVVEPWDAVAIERPELPRAAECWKAIKMAAIERALGGA